MSARSASRKFADVVTLSLPLLAMLLLWQAAVSGGVVRESILPSPMMIGAAGLNLLNDGELLHNLFDTLITSLGGLAIAALVGVPLGAAMAKSRFVDSLFGPLVKATYSLPKTALVPLFFLWFGVGMRTNMTSVALACLLPLLIYAYHGVQAVPKILIWSAQGMGTPPAKIFLRVVLPASMHAILTGLRIALGFSFVVAVAAEMIAAKSGVGKLMVVYGETGAYDYMFAAVAAVVIVAFVFDRALVALNRYLLRWDEATHAAGLA